MTDAPKTWGEMTDAEKGALLLASFYGHVVEIYCGNGLWTACPTLPRDDCAYRLRPAFYRETVTLRSGNPKGDWGVDKDEDDTHKITFELIDGEPDCDSIKMERLK